jgi:glycosyltransferase involved in cell wall biosynthesis
MVIARPAPRTLVIIPAKDEEASLPGVLSALAAAEPDLDVVVVDDGSSDDTARVARARGAVVLSLPFNLGIGGALRTGFRYAVRNGYERALQLDADGQHDPAQIRVLLDALDDGADMAVGNRFGGTGQSYQLSRVRAGAMGVMRFLVRQFSGKPFADTSSGFRAFDRDVLEFFARDYPSEYMESVEALLLACGAGFRVDEVPVRMHRRTLGRPSHDRLRTVFHCLRVVLVITATASRRRPREAAGTTVAPPGPAVAAGHHHRQRPPTRPRRRPAVVGAIDSPEP